MDGTPLAAGVAALLAALVVLVLLRLDGPIRPLRGKKRLLGWRLPALVVGLTLCLLGLCLLTWFYVGLAMSEPVVPALTDGPTPSPSPEL